MTLRRLTLSNIKGLGRKYAAFFFSSTLAVVMFYLIASFVIHPDVVSGYVSQAERVRRGLLVSQYIIMIFTFFFVLYSSSVFIRARKKEFGLLSLLGATKGQITRMLITEHAVIGVTSVALGLGLGIPLSKLMLDAMSRMLQVSSPIRFMVVVPALALTSVLFLSLFALIGTLVSFQISPRKVVRLLREHQRPKALPGYSMWVAAIALLCIGGGYAVAWKVTGQNVVSAMLPVTAVVSLGTYLFFAQASVAIIRMLQKRTAFLYRNLNLITLGDLVFRMKENAWVLATVAVLSAAVITTTGTIYTAQATLLSDEERSYPHALTLAVEGGHDPEELASGVKAIVEAGALTVQEEVVLSGLKASGAGLDNSILIVSERAFNEWAETAGRERIEISHGQAALLVPFEGPASPSGTERFPVEITFQGKTTRLEAAPRQFPRINYLWQLQQYLVIDDSLFSSFAAEATAEDRAVLFSCEFSDWRKALDVSKRIKESLSDKGIIGFASRVENYQARKQMTSLTAMIALFVTALFFIASGSILYFRLFSEVQEDRAKYGMMAKLGVSVQEIRQVVTRQLIVFFFAPIAVGSLHCGFAMKALSNVLSGMHWPFLGVFRYALAAIAGFSFMQVVYFLVARSAYVKEISLQGGA